MSGGTQRVNPKLREMSEEGICNIKNEILWDEDFKVTMKYIIMAIRSWRPIQQVIASGLAWFFILGRKRVGFSYLLTTLHFGHRQNTQII